MQTYIGYGFIAAALVLWVITLPDDPRKSRPFQFVAMMLAVAGLALLQLYGLTPTR